MMSNSITKMRKIMKMMRKTKLGSLILPIESMRDCLRAMDL